MRLKCISLGENASHQMCEHAERVSGRGNGQLLDMHCMHMIRYHTTGRENGVMKICSLEKRLTFVVVLVIVVKEALESRSPPPSNSSLYPHPESQTPDTLHTSLPLTPPALLPLFQKIMPTITTTDHSLRNTLLFLSIFILAFFPSTFHLLLKPLTYPFELLGAEFSPNSRPTLPICNCCPREDCSSSPTTPPQSQEQSAGIMSWHQKTFTLPAKSRGSYLITDEVLTALPEIQTYKVGILHLFIQHTSCALSLNENCDPDVRHDMSA